MKENVLRFVVHDAPPTSFPSFVSKTKCRSLFLDLTFREPIANNNHSCRLWPCCSGKRLRHTGDAHTGALCATTAPAVKASHQWCYVYFCVSDSTATPSLPFPSLPRHRVVKRHAMATTIVGLKNQHDLFCARSMPPNPLWKTTSSSHWGLTHPSIHPPDSR